MTDLYILPEADTHCFDEDTKTDCWSFSRDLLLQEIAKAELRGREARPVLKREPVGFLFQHETGRLRVVMKDDVMDADASWFKVGPLYLGEEIK